MLYVNKLSRDYFVTSSCLLACNIKSYCYSYHEYRNFFYPIIYDSCLAKVRTCSQMTCKRRLQETEKQSKYRLKDEETWMWWGSRELEAWFGKRQEEKRRMDWGKESRRAALISQLYKPAKWVSAEIRAIRPVKQTDLADQLEQCEE